MEKIVTERVLVVEGKYDAACLANVVEGMILTTGGFDIYTNAKKKQLLKNLGRERGLLLLTDSDGAGFQIRNYLKNLVGEQYVLHAYVPAIHGKEKRKNKAGKEGLLGVEGIRQQTLRQSILTALENDCPQQHLPRRGREITYTDLFEWGVSGRENSTEKRFALLQKLRLPPRLSKKELLEVLNTLYTFEELDAKMKAFFGAEQAEI